MSRGVLAGSLSLCLSLWAGTSFTAKCLVALTELCRPLSLHSSSATKELRRASRVCVCVCE